MTDGTQELDPIINIMDMWDFSPFQDEDTRRERVYKEIQAHTNAEIAKAKLEAFDVAFDCHDYDRLRAYRAELLKEVK